MAGPAPNPVFLTAADPVPRPSSTLRPPGGSDTLATLTAFTGSPVSQQNLASPTFWSTFLQQGSPKLLPLFSGPAAPSRALAIRSLRANGGEPLDGAASQLAGMPVGGLRDLLTAVQAANSSFMSDLSTVLQAGPIANDTFQVLAYVLFQQLLGNPDPRSARYAFPTLPSGKVPVSAAHRSASQQLVHYFSELQTASSTSSHQQSGAPPPQPAPNRGAVVPTVAPSTVSNTTSSLVGVRQLSKLYFAGQLGQGLIEAGDMDIDSTTVIEFLTVLLSGAHGQLVISPDWIKQFDKTVLSIIDSLEPSSGAHDKAVCSCFRSIKRMVKNNEGSVPHLMVLNSLQTIPPLSGVAKAALATVKEFIALSKDQNKLTKVFAGTSNTADLTDDQEVGDEFTKLKRSMITMHQETANGFASLKRALSNNSSPPSKRQDSTPATGNKAMKELRSAIQAKNWDITSAQRQQAAIKLLKNRCASCLAENRDPKNPCCPPTKGAHKSLLDTIKSATAFTDL